MVSMVIPWRAIPARASTIWSYSCEDADITWRLAGLFRGLLQERALEPLFAEVEIPLVGVLVRMWAGVLCIL